MTSRPPLAVSQRQPQRTLSGSGLSQRPAQQRSLSQQYFPPSPNRNDLTPDMGDVAQGRCGATPRRGGSRLKLELANDGIDHAGFSESPQNLDVLSANRVFTPSRMMMPLQEASELGDMSPHTSKCQTAENDSTPLPMPPRRGRFVVPATRPQTATPSTSAPVKKDTRPKPFVLETPSAAPRYSNMGRQEPSGFADFYPWHGDHPEDRFSESSIRNGYFDRAPSQPQTELSSAKGSLFPSLKHKSGLHTLSTLFTGILNQRRHSGQVTAASTFKPPPRVTLTDTKREVWLKDLANPTISLRRLSRTIPHGVRGKALLEQSLNKNVPTERAVWLAKCVGANEIRAFKRKGVNNTFVVNGETKWIREWTVCVEQFLEAVVSAFGEAEWKAKVTYAIRLATHLYAEHLLDRDHYMDWLVSGLENSNKARLPMWLLMMRIYWKDLIRLRKTGRRLVTAVASQHAAIQQHPDRDVLAPLSMQLSSLVESLILNNPESFVHPPTWSKYRDALLASTSSHQAQQISLKSIERRNERLTSTHIKSQPAVRGILVKLLDTTLRMPFKDDLANQVWKVSDDKIILIRTLLEWSTSLYRPGIAKVYVTANILRSFLILDADVTGAVLDFLDTDPLQETERKHLVYHLVSELVRTGHFQVPRYLQWLIARGGLANNLETQPDGPCLTRLLVEVPIQPLGEQMRSLRATILRKADFLVEDEASNIDNAIKYVKHALGVPLEHNGPMLKKKPMSINKLAYRIGLESRTLQTEIGSWLYHGFIAVIMQNSQSNKGGVELPITKFDSVRTLLEAAQDYVMLQNVLRTLVVSSNAELLASCADTVNLHIRVFAATGSAKSLFNALLLRLKAVSEEQGIGARPLLASLTSLASRMPGLEQIAAQLQVDLIRTDRSSAVDASSPLSDNMATQLQDDETELNEQIEKLASYTSADRQTMERLFQAIIGRLRTCWNKDDERQRPYCVLLTRLRVFDTQYFDMLMRGWLQHVRKLTDRPAIAQVLPLLISFGCLPLSILFATASRNSTQSGQIHPSPVKSASIYNQEVLQMLMLPSSPNRIMTFEDCYRFRIIQEQARLEHAKEVMHLIRGALAEYSASRNQQEPVPQPFDDEKTKSQFMELLRSLILVDPNAAGQTLSIKGQDLKLGSLVESVTTRLLIPRGGGGQKTMEQVLELANEFTLPFCQVKLLLNLAVYDSAGPEAAERLQLQLLQLSKAMDNAIDANNIMWTGMLSCLSSDITHHMKIRAEARFLDLIPSLKNPVASEEASHKDIHMAENLVAVIDSIIRGATISKSSQLSNAMVDKLADLWEIIASPNAEIGRLKALTLTHWLPLLLSYLNLHACSVTNEADSSKPSHATRARALLVLAGLTQELDNHPSGLSERAFDLALILVDVLADDPRLQCVRAVKDATADPRLRYLFSFAPNPAENLQLAHREKPPANMGPNARRALAMGVNMGMSMLPERLSPFVIRRWEILNEPTPNVGENDTSLSLHLFEARKIS